MMVSLEDGTSTVVGATVAVGETTGGTLSFDFGVGTLDSLDVGAPKVVGVAVVVGAPGASVIVGMTGTGTLVPSCE
jgi:hypothetical protein